MILLSLFWRTSLFVASLYCPYSIHLVFNTLSFFCRSPNCHISPQLPPLPLTHPPSRHQLPTSPVPLLHPVPTTDYSSSLSSFFLVPSVNSFSSIRLLCRLYRQFLFANTVSLSSLRSILPCHYSLFSRQYEPLHVTVREVLLTFALIQPTLDRFPHFVSYPPTLFFFCSCTIWLIKVIPTPSF